MVDLFSQNSVRTILFWTQQRFPSLLAHRGPGAACEIYREFRTSRRALNVLFVRAGL